MSWQIPRIEYVNLKPDVASAASRPAPHFHHILIRVAMQAAGTSCLSSVWIYCGERLRFDFTVDFI
jgi:hypothetical protein